MKKYPLFAYKDCLNCTILICCTECKKQKMVFKIYFLTQQLIIINASCKSGFKDIRIRRLNEASFISFK